MWDKITTQAKIQFSWFLFVLFCVQNFCCIVLKDSLICFAAEGEWYWCVRGDFVFWILQFFSIYFIFILFFLYFLFTHDIYPHPHPRPTTHTHDPRPLPTTHDPRPTTFSYTLAEFVCMVSIFWIVLPQFVIAMTIIFYSETSIKRTPN